MGEIISDILLEGNIGKINATRRNYFPLQAFWAADCVGMVCGSGRAGGQDGMEGGGLLDELELWNFSGRTNRTWQNI